MHWDLVAVHHLRIWKTKPIAKWETGFKMKHEKSIKGFPEVLKMQRKGYVHSKIPWYFNPSGNSTPWLFSTKSGWILPQPTSFNMPTCVLKQWIWSVDQRERISFLTTDNDGAAPSSGAKGEPVDLAVACGPHVFPRGWMSVSHSPWTDCQAQDTLP